MLFSLQYVTSSLTEALLDTTRLVLPPEQLIGCWIFIGVYLSQKLQMHHCVTIELISFTLEQSPSENSLDYLYMPKRDVFLPIWYLQ